MIKKFNVIIENNGKFEPYDIMPYLKRKWNEFKKNVDLYKDDKDNDYWIMPKTYKEIKNWVIRELKYQYWGRCQYEMILSAWPNPRGENGRKIDIYEQCEMNIDLIVRIFIEDIYLKGVYN